MCFAFCHFHGNLEDIAQHNLFFKCTQRTGGCTLSRDRDGRVVMLATHVIKTASCTCLQVCLSNVFLCMKMTPTTCQKNTGSQHVVLAASGSTIAPRSSSVPMSYSTTLTGVWQPISPWHQNTWCSYQWGWPGRKGLEREAAGLILPGQGKPMSCHRHVQRVSLLPSVPFVLCKQS